MASANWLGGGPQFLSQVHLHMKKHNRRLKADIQMAAKELATPGICSAGAPGDAPHLETRHLRRQSRQRPAMAWAPPEENLLFFNDPRFTWRRSTAGGLAGRPASTMLWPAAASLSTSPASNTSR